MDPERRVRVRLTHTQYARHEGLISEMGITVVGRSLIALPDTLRRLAAHMDDDGDSKRGLDGVTATERAGYRRAARRIRRALDAIR